MFAVQFDGVAKKKDKTDEEGVLETLTEEASGYVVFMLTQHCCLLFYQNLFRPKNWWCTSRIYETDKLVNCFKVKQEQIKLKTVVQLFPYV